jgi:uncharacterized membrane protein
MFARGTLPILALMAAACGSDNPPPPAVPVQQPAAAPAAPRPAASMLVRGIVKLTPAPSFQPCGGTLMNVVDSSGDRLVSTYHFMHAGEEEGMYVLARGETTAQGQMVLHALEFAGRPSATENCEQPAPDYLVLLRGAEPEWSLKLTESTLTFSQPSQADPLSFPAPVPDDSAGFRRYQASTPGGLHTIHVLLRRTNCSEGRTGVYAAIAASVVLDGIRLQGCGWRGRL